MSTTTSTPRDASPPAGPPSGALGIEVQPDDDYFDLMARIAEDHWWYRGRRAWLRQELGPRLTRGGLALDIGTGTAESLTELEALGAGVAVGTDLSEHVLRYVVGRPHPPRVLRSLAEQLPFATDSAACLISMDVVEHLDDDVAALAEYRRVLHPGGLAYVTTNSYQWLWSEHDVRAAHRRRYTVPQLEAVVRSAGFEVEHSTYYYSFLVPPAFLLRRTPLRRLVTATDDEVSTMHPAIDAVFGLLARLERALGRRVRIPFGLSMVVIARNPG